MKVLAALPLVACVMLAGCASTPPNPQPPGTEECQPTSIPEIQALFARWNRDLENGDATTIVRNNYADSSILLPTAFSTRPVLASFDDKRGYFVEFLKNEPSGRVTSSFVVLGCNRAVDAGLYTFTYHASGKTVPARYTYTYSYFPALSEWLITTHHSSVVPTRSDD